jgi:hypothetical protein
LFQQEANDSRATVESCIGVGGLLFTAGIYPVVSILWGRDQAGYTDAMMLSLYVTLGILLLLAVRNPVGASQPDSFRRMVERCSRHGHDHHGLARC